jgi:hypothetical protein
MAERKAEAIGPSGIGVGYDRFTAATQEMLVVTAPTDPSNGRLDQKRGGSDRSQAGILREHRLRFEAAGFSLDRSSKTG